MTNIPRSTNRACSLYNETTEYGGLIVHNASRPAAGCTPVGGATAISEYRRDA